jgi:hypothetical protein
MSVLTIVLSHPHPLFVRGGTGFDCFGSPFPKIDKNYLLLAPSHLEGRGLGVGFYKFSISPRPFPLRKEGE